MHGHSPGLRTAAKAPFTHKTHGAESLNEMSSWGSLVPMSMLSCDEESQDRDPESALHLADIDRTSFFSSCLNGTAPGRYSGLGHDPRARHQRALSIDTTSDGESDTFPLFLPRVNLPRDLHTSDTHKGTQPLLFVLRCTDRPRDQWK